MELRKAWCRETAHPSYQDKWSEDNPSAGQCLVTALIVQERHGGDIYSCKVGNNSHFVNVIDERIIDMTTEQFGGTSNIKYVSGSFRKRTRASLIQNKDVKRRYELLKARLEEN
ncbi:MAG: hypothetical protein UH850_14825 [Paludibacteraceae bacterium]|nr:hypothetical protein [Paludibacteraceae bacterium]